MYIGISIIASFVNHRKSFATNSVRNGDQQSRTFNAYYLDCYFMTTDMFG